ncbi:unnamed protein product [Protopolystoma xenopodis]|uniref:Uncharacterized protein n=1 Tax=Protopolystoma xenopodis TaxID=117903 RepID=A0A3S5CVZ3_9PLAT|nr:unnamed protein product [Protopolystoma xenopodis]
MYNGPILRNFAMSPHKSGQTEALVTPGQITAGCSVPTQRLDKAGVCPLVGHLVLESSAVPVFGPATGSDRISN